MVLSEFNKLSLSQFRGLYQRGLPDEVPQDHAIVAQNVAFDKRGEFYPRAGSKISLTLSHPVKRMFLATTNQGYFLLTFDGAGQIWAYGSFQTAPGVYTTMDIVLLVAPKMLDFCALNNYGKVYIQPAGQNPNNGIDDNLITWVWDGTYDSTGMLYKAMIPMAGYPPQNTGIPMSVASGGAGSTSPGLYKFAVSFITKTGYMTRPGFIDHTDHTIHIPVTWTSPGDVQAVISNVPAGPIYVIARQLFVTKADEEEYFYMPNGYIPDNTTSTVTRDWFDTDLVVSADDLFDNLDVIPCGLEDNFGLFKYHGRTMVWGNPQDIGVDKILVSDAGDPETFKTTHGFIQLPTEFDGNYVRGAALLRDTIYFTKSVGIFSTQDNLDNPATWPVVRVDGASGAWFYCVGTITASQPALPIGDLVILADLSGVYVFNGVVQSPLISWKINDLWERIPKAFMSKITLEVDPFSQLIYVLIPIDSDTQPSYLLVGDFSEGMTMDAIKWSNYILQFPVRSIGMANFQDASDFHYHLRLGTDSSGLYKLDENTLTDVKTDGSTAGISWIYEPSSIGLDLGKLSIFRALNFRTYGSGPIVVQIKGENGVPTQYPIDPPPFTVITSNGDFTRQINLTNEKMRINLSGTSIVKMNRIDIYGKTQFDTRPM